MPNQSRLLPLTGKAAKASVTRGIPPLKRDALPPLPSLPRRTARQRGMKRRRAMRVDCEGKPRLRRNSLGGTPFQRRKASMKVVTSA